MSKISAMPSFNRELDKWYALPHCWARKVYITGSLGGGNSTVVEHGIYSASLMRPFHSPQSRPLTQGLETCALCSLTRRRATVHETKTQTTISETDSRSIIRGIRVWHARGHSAAAKSETDSPAFLVWKNPWARRSRRHTSREH